MTGQRGPGSDGNKGVLCVPQSSSITETSLSDCLESYPGHSLEGGSYPYAEVKHIHKHEYGYVWNGWNVHRMFVTYIQREHRNLEIRKHVTTSLFRYEIFLLHLSSRFRHKERDTIFLCWLLHLAPISCGTHGAQIRLALASPKSRTSPFGV